MQSVELQNSGTELCTKLSAAQSIALSIRAELTRETEIRVCYTVHKQVGTALVVLVRGETPLVHILLSGTAQSLARKHPAVIDVVSDAAELFFIDWSLAPPRLHLSNLRPQSIHRDPQVQEDELRHLLERSRVWTGFDQSSPPFTHCIIPLTNVKGTVSWL